jgi:glutamate/aspartate transport system ATP-binding protein
MMIEIDNVSKSYGSFRVLKNCSASIADGEVVVICGPSGSGKSTLIKTVNGLETIDTGEINVSGFRLAPDVTNVAALRRSSEWCSRVLNCFPI